MKLHMIMNNMWHNFKKSSIKHVNHGQFFAFVLGGFCFEASHEDFFFAPINFQREWKGESGERHTSVWDTSTCCFQHTPQWGAGWVLEPRYLPQSGIEPSTLCAWTKCSIHCAHRPGHSQFLRLIQYAKIGKYIYYVHTFLGFVIGIILLHILHTHSHVPLDL